MSKGFKNCQALKTIGDFFTFPATIENLAEVFYNCFSLEEIPEYIWPEDFTTTINFTEGFKNCKNAKGFLPYWKLWNGENDWAPDKPMTFAECINVDNWEYVPTTWGGLCQFAYYPNFEFELTIPSGGGIFKFPVKKTFQTFEGDVPQIKEARYGFIINWGDYSADSAFTGTRSRKNCIYRK